MRVGRTVLAAGAVWAAAVTATLAQQPPDRPRSPNLIAYQNPFGELRTYKQYGAIDLGSLFFQSAGTNGRACVTCHDPSNGWTITPSHIQAQFDATDGLDPLFRTNDGSTSPWADVSTSAARRTAYALLLSRGLIRVGIGVPAGAEFALVDVDDPYGYASAAELSLFRRPLPSTNLGFLSDVMWDGRETFSGQSIHFDLSDQSNGATLGHAAATNPLTPAQRDEIVAFETGLTSAQSWDWAAGSLQGQGGSGGPVILSSQPFFIGINDVLGSSFDPRVFTLFDRWSDIDSADQSPFTAARASIARGQAIFNTRTMTMTNVRGLNDRLGVSAVSVTCTTCHNVPNVGNQSRAMQFDLGLSGESRRTPDMPLYTFRNLATGATIKTTDPGRALITGKWNDMSLFKVPILRGLASRAPYFHNGVAETVEEVVGFYNGRFRMGLSAQDKADLAAFLRAL